jgi:hypothetical protein
MSAGRQEKVMQVAAARWSAYVKRIRLTAFWHCNMIRLFFRIIALLFLAGAVVAAVVDSSRSIAASAFSLTSFGEVWSGFAPDSLSKMQELGPQYLGSSVWSFVSNFVMAMPAVAILMALALLFYAIGYKRQSRYGRFASN